MYNVLQTTPKELLDKYLGKKVRFKNERHRETFGEYATVYEIRFNGDTATSDPIFYSFVLEAEKNPLDELNFVHGFNEEHFQLVEETWEEPISDDQRGFNDGFRECCRGFYGDNCEILDTPWAVGYNQGWQRAKDLGFHGIHREQHDREEHLRSLDHAKYAWPYIKAEMDMGEPISEEIRKEIFGAAV